MKIDWIIVAIVGVGAIILIFLLVRQNLKDKKDATRFFNEQYKTNIEEESEQDDALK
jgi:hypothetical protein